MNDTPVVTAGASQTDRIVLSTPRMLARHAAEWLVRRAQTSEGPVGFCLSGGSSPEALYRLLATPGFRKRLPWPRLHWFWGDERFVAADDPRSNYRMAREALLDHVPAPPENIHPIPTHLASADAAALAYEGELKRFYGADTLSDRKPLFAATILGLGPDGHTASLFPGTPAVEEKRRWVAAVAEAPLDPHVPRITLTLPALESSGEVAFIASGPGKQDMLARVWHGEDLPAGRVQPAGRLHWFIDRAAAPLSDRKSPP